MRRTAHEIVNPLTLAEPVGHAHVVEAAPGRTVYLGGQIARRPGGGISGDTVVQQFDVALGNVVEALRAVGGRPHDLVSMLIYTTAVGAYRVNRRTLGSVYRRHMGRHYPAMALFGATELFEPKALIELVCTAVIPGQRAAVPEAYEDAELERLP